jgi:hypothetical protein
MLDSPALAAGARSPHGTPAYVAPRPGELGALMRSFDRSLRALGRSPLTREQYLMSVGQMIDYFARAGMPDAPSGITREHVRRGLFRGRHPPSRHPTGTASKLEQSTGG